MDINLEPGKYVVAVSGGVDSVVLLNLLAESPELRVQSRGEKSSQLIVAHFDHGIREDSEEDRQFVQGLAKRYGLPFVYDEGRLGEGASEAVARKARYEFLHRTREAANARAIITAHHQDDLLETAVINLIRGTGRRGLSSLKSIDDIVRPLLHVPKQRLIAYAKAQRLQWREDSTNQDTAYLRNHIRHKILPHMSESQRDQLLSNIDTLHKLNAQIDQKLTHFLQGQSLQLERQAFVMLPHAVAREVMAGWLRGQDVRDYDKKTLERLVIAAKTYQNGKIIDVNKQYVISVTRQSLALQRRDR